MSESHGSGLDRKENATILLVDDNDDICEVTSMLLAKLGYQVIAAKAEPQQSAYWKKGARRSTC